MNKSKNNIDKKENILGTERIWPLILRMSLPLMASMLVQALYNIVDSVFVSMVSEEALTAVSLAFPLQSLIIAFSVGTSVGMASYMGRKLGEKKEEEATITAGNGFFLSIITWIMFLFVGFFLSKPFLRLFSSDTSLVGLSSEYLQIVLVGSLFVLLQTMGERVLQSLGKSVQSMLGQIAGAVTNIILDPVFIFVFKMGVKGAAVATVIGQGVGLVVVLIFVLNSKMIHLKFSHLKPRWKTIKEIYRVGIPTIITNGIGTIMTSGINMILSPFSTTSVAVFGAYFKLQSFVFMPILGLNSGMVPIVSYNYGARNKKRITETVKKGVAFAICLALLGTALFQLFPHFLLSLFSATDEMYSLGLSALKTISFGFIFGGISIALSSSFQGTGFGIGTMLNSITRQLIVLLPCAYLFSRYYGVSGVWASFPVAEAAGLVVSSTVYIYVYKKRIKPLGEKNTLENQE